jgi:hypothetical protein
MKKEIINMGLIIIFLILMIIIHEKVHMNNCAYFGGTPGPITIEKGTPGVTCTGADNPQRHLGDTINDAIGYTIIPIMMLYLAIKL